ncbi:YncE family protein [Lacinutrix salivirga]
MKKFTLALLVVITSFFSCNSDDDTVVIPGDNIDYFAVANRGSGTVTIYNADTKAKITDITLPDADAAPTYVTYSTQRDMLYVSDFNNSKVIAYNAADFSVADTYTTQMGSFHMWLNDTADQLWVNNISAKTTSVINLETGNTIDNLDLPSGIILNADAAQHDVILSPNGDYAYVSIFSQAGNNYVTQYNTTDLSVVGSVQVGGDPHLTVNNNFLYILSQADGNIKEYNFNDLSETGKSGDYSNAHGVTQGNNNDIYITNISDRAIGTYNTATEAIGATADATATAGAAHNLAFNPNANILALTISGGTTVEFFDTTATTITASSDDNSGENPFGIVYADR